MGGVARPKPVVELHEVDNPQYLVYNPELKRMFKKFVEEHLKIPSITYETFHAFCCHNVEQIALAKLNKVPPTMMRLRFVVGMRDGELKGFFRCSALPDRMPHAATMEVTYAYSEDPYVSVEFARKVNEYKKLWRMKHLSFIVVNENLMKAVKRSFKDVRLCGYYMFASGVKDKLVEPRGSEEVDGDGME